MAAGSDRPPRMRLFAAVEIPPAVAAPIAEEVERLRPAFRELRWTDPAGWHLTLAFLGGVDPGLLGPVSEALAAAAAGAAPFPLTLTGEARSFSSGALWAAVDEEAALADLASDVVGRLRRVVALPDADRAFRPHLTLARSRRRVDAVRQAAAAYRGPTLDWTVERIVLMRSHLHPSGARYEVVGAWALAAPRRRNVADA